MRDDDMRREAKRLADVVLRLAADPEAVIGIRPGRYAIEDVVAAAGADELIIDWEHDCQRLTGTDAQGPIALGLRIDPAHIDRGRCTLHHKPSDFIDIASLLSETVTENRALPHEDLHIVLGEAEKWNVAGDMLHHASEANPDITIVLGGGVEPGMHLEITSSGAHGVTGPSVALRDAVATLPRSPMLTWKRAESAQALAKRRDHGVPPMGWASVRPARVVWKPHDRAASDRGAAYILRPAIPVSRIDPVPVPDGRRFEWALEEWEDVKFFSELKAELQRALEPILVVNNRMLMQQLELVRRKGQWAQRFAKRGDVPEISCKDANLLLRVGLLERRRNMLAASETFHMLLRGLVATGHDSWAGVRQIRRLELVPKGIDYQPQPYAYLRSGGHGVARLAKEGFSIESLYFDATTPTLARAGYAKSGLTPNDPVIAVIVQQGMAWPDFTRDIRAEMDGRIGVPCNPALDHRYLPGALGALYRAPLEDRQLIQRYLRWIHTCGKLPEWEAWRTDRDDLDDY